MVEVATRNAELFPSVASGYGVVVSDDRTQLTIYVPDGILGATVENARANGQLAVIFVWPPDERSIQVKGEFVEARASTQEDKELQERYLERVVDGLAQVGVSPTAIRRKIYWPSTAITLSVRETFVQTPGPGAGAPLVA